MRARGVLCIAKRYVRRSGNMDLGAYGHPHQRAAVAGREAGGSSSPDHRTKPLVILSPGASAR